MHDFFLTVGVVNTGMAKTHYLLKVGVHVITKGVSIQNEPQRIFKS